MATRLLLLTALLLGACTTPQHTPETARPQTRQIDPAAGPETKQSRLTMLAAVQPITGVMVAPYEHPVPEDLWAKLRQGFALPDRYNDRVHVQRSWYAKHPRYMQRVTERSRRYAWHIQQELARRNMPAEIALLPIVESAYDPFAYSHGRAAGLWQFIPATGKRFGLKQTWWYDGRRDLLDSTNAALDYLQYLNKRFKGDWLLALAAYNSGEGTVSKAVRRNLKKGKPITFWDLKLPKETRAYVPKLIALKQLVDRPAIYGIELDPLPNEPYFEIVSTGGQIDMAVAANLAGIELEALYRLNPGYNQWATSPKGPHRLLIPMDQASAFRQAIADLPPEKRVQWERHKIRNGESLGEIAKRYHTTVSALKAANGVNGTSIRAGKHLLVPVSSQGQDSYKLSSGQRLKRKQDHKRKGYKARHIVSPGDTFWDLSREYKVSVRKLAAWNGMAPGDPLRVGQKLVVWTRLSSSKSFHPGAQIRPIYYTVRKGDSLSRISGKFRVPVADLRKWNTLPRGRYLQPGQRIKLYVDVTQQTGT